MVFRAHVLLRRPHDQMRTPGIISANSILERNDLQYFIASFFHTWVELLLVEWNFGG